MADMKKEPNCQIYGDGRKEWHLNGRLHREDGPAVIRSDGTEVWYVKGECHRIDGPAITWLDGTEFWRLNGERHREDGPAVTYPDGSFGWWFNDNLYSFNEWCKKLKLSPEKIVELKLVYG